MLRNIRDWCLIAPLYLILYLGRLLSYEKRINIGANIITFIFAWLPPILKRLNQTLPLIYPALKGRERRQFIRRNIRHFAQNILETQNIDEFSRNTDRFHASGDGLDIIREAIKNNNGYIIVSGHIGQWEAIRAYLAQVEGKPLASIYKESKNPYYEELWREKLQFNGAIVKTGTKGTRDLIRLLKAGLPISILHDQRLYQGQLFNFMGHQAQTSMAASELALKYNVPLISAYAIRRPNNFDYDIIFEAPVLADNPTNMTQAICDSLGQQVLEHPEQWYWLHNRWKINKPS